MSEIHSDSLEYYISPGCSGSSSGSADQPYTSLSEAFEKLPEKLVELNDGNTGRKIELVCIASPGVQTKPPKKAKHRFYVDTKAGGVDGQGTELAPWADLVTGFKHLKDQTDQGRLDLKPGQKIRVTMREVFTSTDQESLRSGRELIARVSFGIMAWSLVVPIFAILGYLVYKAAPSLNLDFLLTNPKDGMTAGGIWTPLLGTFMLVLISLAIAAPIGILAGVYLNEYAGDNWFTRVINLAVINLAGVPSIVHGLFGVGAFVLFMKMGVSLLAASCTIAVMTLPVIITSTKEALAAVPMAFREACWNLGATRWQTIRTIVLPNSIAGILTGVILQVARAAGETAPILFTGVTYYVIVSDDWSDKLTAFGLNDSFMALSNHLFKLASNVKGVPDSILYGTAVVLIALVLVVNSISVLFRLYLRSRKKW